jgi:hypothetical protein
MHTVGQFDRNRNLPPQSQFPASEKRRATAERREFGFECRANPVEFVLQCIAMAPIADRL